MSIFPDWLVYESGNQVSVFYDFNAEIEEDILNVNIESEEINIEINEEIIDVEIEEDLLI